MSKRKKFRISASDQEKLSAAFSMLEDSSLQEISEQVIGGRRLHGQTHSETGGHGQTHSQTGGGHGQTHSQTIQ